MENVCIYHTDHVTRIGKVEKTCEELDDRLTDLDKNTAVTNQRVLDALENLSRLPDIMEDMKNTMISMQREISDSNKRIGGLENQVDSLQKDFKDVDEQGKFNFRKWTGEHSISIAVGLTALMAYGTWWISNLFK